MDLMLSLDRDLASALRDQVYGGLRGAILDGRLPPGTRVPATRVLASQLNLSRFTVEDAYAQLIAEGYLVGRRGSGTYVSPDVVVPRPTASGQRLGRLPRRSWSRWGAQLAVGMPPAPGGTELRFTFRAGMTAMDAFPHALWNRTLGRVARQVSIEQRDYGPSSGYPPLRTAVAAYLARSRGLSHDAGQVVISSGIQQALDLLTRLWLEPGETVAVEDPGYPSARVTFAMAGADVVPIPVDEDGMRVELLDTLAPRAKLIYVTPSHQYPTGGVLSLVRRWTLLRWARAHDALIVEDDYDSEFRYGARPIPAMAGLDAAAGDVVVYLGTFSKVLYPSLRLGYAVLPPDMVDRFVAAKRIADHHSPTLEQAALAAFIGEGHFERHLARMRRLYAKRRAALVDALAEELPGIAIWSDKAASGLHLLVGFDLPISEAELLRLAARGGVALDPAAHCFVAQPPSVPSALLGYAMLTEEEIWQGIQALAGGLLGHVEDAEWSGILGAGRPRFAIGTASGEEQSGRYASADTIVGPESLV